MVAFRVVGPAEAIGALDFATLALLFSMMLIVGNLRLAGVFDWLTEWIVEHVSRDHLLPAVVFTSGVLSAILVNDVICLVMTPFVLRVARRIGVEPLPYLLAVATASNIGSVATITGNPQNMLIGSQSQISYVEFAARLAPVAAIGLFADWALIHWLLLRGGRGRVAAPEAPVSRGPSPFALRKKPVVVLGAVLIAFFAGAPPALAAAVGAALLLITRTVEPKKVYDEVDWGLLVFFTGLFVIVRGAESSGLVASLLRPIPPGSLRWLPGFVAATAALANVVSNVPAVMLLKSFATTHAGWVALAMSSTLAGNLTITGSVADIIVVEGARAEGVHVGFREYFRVGAPVAIVTLAIGTAWLWWVG